MSEASVAFRGSRRRRATRGAAALVAVMLVGASALLIASPAYAAGFIDGDFEYESTSATTAMVTDYTGGPSATIPSTASDGTSTYTVTAIDGSAFSSKGLTSATIPDSVTYIGGNAFGSNSLTSIVIPDSVTAMGSYAFQWNDLTSATLGSGLTSIPAGAFYGNQLSSIDIPTNITTIGDSAFVNNSFVSLTIPDSITSIGASAFVVSGLLTSVTFGTSLTSIGAYAFAGTALTSVTIPASVTEIGDGAFDTTPGMTSVVFRGTAPTTFTARSAGDPSLGDVDATVYYSSAHAADFTPSPWNGYDTALGATLTFSLGGHGPTIAPVVVIPGATVPAPADPTAIGYAFDGWFTTATGDEAYDFTTPLTADATAYARWTSTDLAATGAEPAPFLVGAGLLTLLGVLALLVVGVRFRTARVRAGGRSGRRMP